MARLVLVLMVVALTTSCSSMWKSKSASDKRPTTTASASGGSTAPRSAELPAGVGSPAKMEPKRNIVEADCSKAVDFTQGGNLRCKK